MNTVGIRSELSGGKGERVESMEVSNLNWMIKMAIVLYVASALDWINKVEKFGFNQNGNKLFFT